MTIELKPEQQRMIDLAIKSGAYHDSDEVIATALSMLAEDGEDAAERLAERREAVATRIAEGFAQAERGELMDGDAAVEMLRQRRAERLNTQE
jgi:putative addiction module CopG family antidote